MVRVLYRIHSLLFLHHICDYPPLQVLFYTTCQPHIRTYRKGSLQFASGNTETVEHQVLPHTVNPFAPGGQDSTHKVPTLSLTTGETPHNLQQSKIRGEGKMMNQNANECRILSRTMQLTVYHNMVTRETICKCQFLFNMSLFKINKLMNDPSFVFVYFVYIFISEIYISYEI